MRILAWLGITAVSLIAMVPVLIILPIAFVGAVVLIVLNWSIETLGYGAWRPGGMLMRNLLMGLFLGAILSAGVAYATHDDHDYRTPWAETDRYRQQSEQNNALQRQYTTPERRQPC